MRDVAPPRERLDFLDAARGLAVLLVLAEHSLDACLPDLLKSIIGHGNLGRAGVVLFLLISGFIIPASLEKGGSQKRFWLRRFFRLFPAYWLSIALAFGFHLVSEQSLPQVQAIKRGDWLLNLTMLQGYFGRPNVWGVFWTLQLELTIYATCALLYSASLLQRTVWIAGLALGAYALIGLGRPILMAKPFAIGGTSYLYFAPLAGMVAQRFWAGQLDLRTLISFGLAQWGIVVAVWTLNHALFPAKMTSDCLWEIGCSWGIAYACFFLLLAMRHRAMPPGFGWLGRISYSVYLLHPPVLALLIPQEWPIWAFLTVFLSSTLLLAELSYRFVEKPGIALGRAVERHRREASALPVVGLEPPAIPIA